jgi:hypothetical protein
MIDFVIWLILRICLPLMPIWVSGAAKGFGFDKIDFTFPNETIIVIGFILPIVVAKDLRNRQTLWLVILGCLPGFLLYTFAIFAKSPDENSRLRKFGIEKPHITHKSWSDFSMCHTIWKLPKSIILTIWYF